MTAYDTGTSGFNITVALGKMMKEKYGADARVLPAGNDVARLQPLRTGRASLAAMGVGVFFAQEGLFEFATREWGPQPLQITLSSVDCRWVSSSNWSAVSWFSIDFAAATTRLSMCPTLDCARPITPIAPSACPSRPKIGAAADAMSCQTLRKCSPPTTHAEGVGTDMAFVEEDARLQSRNPKALALSVADHEQDAVCAVHKQHHGTRAFERLL